MGRDSAAGVALQPGAENWSRRQAQSAAGIQVSPSEASVSGTPVSPSRTRDVEEPTTSRPHFLCALRAGPARGTAPALQPVTSLTTGGCRRSGLKRVSSPRQPHSKTRRTSPLRALAAGRGRARDAPDREARDEDGGPRRHRGPPPAAARSEPASTPPTRPMHWWWSRIHPPSPAGHPPRRAHAASVPSPSIVEPAC